MNAPATSLWLVSESPPSFGGQFWCMRTTGHLNSGIFQILWRRTPSSDKEASSACPQGNPKGPRDARPEANPHSKRDWSQKVGISDSLSLYESINSEACSLWLLEGPLPPRVSPSSPQWPSDSDTLHWLFLPPYLSSPPFSLCFLQCSPQ